MTTHEQLTEIFESPRCFCGRVKKMQQPFCTTCFYALPAASRQFVKYIRNENFNGTYDAALDFLREHTNVNQNPA